MNLIHNMVCRILDEAHEGIYRVILDEPEIERTILVRLDQPDIRSPSHGGRPRSESTKRPRPKPPLAHIGRLHWFDRSELMQFEQQSMLVVVRVEPEATLLTRSYLEDSETEQRQFDKFQKRLQIMEEFLTFDSLRDGILIDHGLGGLVRRAMKAHGAGRSQVYKLFSLLCRHGFSELSLHPRYDNCGAPGVPRPCDPGGRAKAGAKTTKQRISREYGEILAPEQPGMSTEWRQRIIAADRTIPRPKPSMSERVKKIFNKAFVTKYQQHGDGTFTAIDPEFGAYPNDSQIQYVLETEIPKLERLQQRTTKSHFQRSMRGLSGRNWQGVAGPGHTWAIDSTVGDVYLRSSINRSWIVGRPVVYVIVDVWSTAIVGFYVCLAGPSWDMAKIALFSSVADPQLLGQLWGYEPILSLFPEPTLCTHLLCDRGEYLSRAASATGMKLLPAQSYTPPYRPDLKGLVEVLHRIEKDKQFNFMPGAIDHRRKEFDLRRYDPNQAALTVAEFTCYLHLTFAEYNLTANREHRLDAHMRAAGVDATPAGLWRWGHDMGIGVRRLVSQSELVSILLPQAKATVKRDGVFFGGKSFESEIVRDREWITSARNFGSYELPCHYFPGSVSRIWTPYVGERGLLELHISEQSAASPELTWDEVADAEMYYDISRADRKHKHNVRSIQIFQRMESLIEGAKARKDEADAKEGAPRPSLRDARTIEKGVDDLLQSTTEPEVASTDDGGVSHDRSDEHAELMRRILEGIEEDQ